MAPTSKKKPAAAKKGPVRRARGVVQDDPRMYRMTYRQWEDLSQCLAPIRLHFMGGPIVEAVSKSVAQKAAKKRGRPAGNGKSAQL